MWPCHTYSISHFQVTVKQKRTIFKNDNRRRLNARVLKYVIQIYSGPIAILGGCSG